MEITLKDIIEKYPTNIDLDSMSNKLKNKVMFGGKGTYYEQFGDISIDDVKEPKYDTYDKNITSKNKESFVAKNYEKYIYSIKDLTLEIEFNPSNYRTMGITLIKPDDTIDEGAYIWHYNYEGESDRVY